MFVDPSKSRRWYHNRWRDAVFERDELRERVRTLEGRIDHRDDHLRKLRREAKSAKGRAVQARKRAERLDERIENIDAYRDVVKRTLTLLAKTRPGCSCALWKKKRRHAENCTIIQRAEIESRAEKLGIGHWRNE